MEHWTKSVMDSKTKEFSKKVKLVCSKTNRMNLQPKQVIEDVINHCCFILINKEFITDTFPRTLFQFSKDMIPNIKHYKEEPTAHTIIKELCTDYIALMMHSEPFTDVLGMLYDEHLGQVLGQFLTPPDVADVLAAITYGLNPITDDFNLTDPCGCGAGSLLLGSLRYIYNTHGKEGISKTHVMAVDLDVNMVRMATVQIVLNSILHNTPLASFKISRGNAISQYTAINNNELVAFWWMPNTPLEMYAEATGNVEIKKVIELLQVFNEVTSEIKNGFEEQQIEKEAA